MRACLAVGLVACLVSGASAARAPACICRSDVTLPRPGATNVPTNARFWSIPASSLVDTPDQRIQVYELAPHTTYELNAQHLSFTTGDGPDDIPPAQPTVAGITIAAGEHDGGLVALLHLAATFDADTAVVRIEITGRTTQTTLYTTPDVLSICDPGFSVNDGVVDVRVTAIDLAGNASPPVTLPTRPIITAGSSPSCVEARHHNHGTDYIVYFLLAPFVLALAYLLGLAITANARAGARKTVEATPLAITAAEALARGIKRRAVTGMAIVAGGTALAFRSETVAVLVLFGSPVLLIGVIVEIVRWFAARRALRLASYEGATATVCRDEVRITVGGQHATLRAAPWRVERAKEHGVPRATL